MFAPLSYYSFSQSFWYIIINICKPVSVFHETICTNSTRQMDYQQEPVTCSKYMAHLSKVNNNVMSMNISVQSDWQALVSLFKKKRLGHVFNITVYIKIYCQNTLWWRLWWQTLIENRPGQAGLFLYGNINFSSTKLHITVCGILIARDWTGFIFTLFWQQIRAVVPVKHTLNFQLINPNLAWAVQSTQNMFMVHG